MSTDLEKIKDVVAQFFERIQQEEWEKAGKLTQPSWREMVAPQSPADRLEDLFGHRGISGYEIGEAMRASDVMYDVIVDLTFGDSAQERRFVIRVICEKGSYKPSTEGKWGVNPNSMRAQR